MNKTLNQKADNINQAEEKLRAYYVQQKRLKRKQVKDSGPLNIASMGPIR